jgi:hypothetical protein
MFSISSLLAASKAFAPYGPRFVPTPRPAGSGSESGAGSLAGPGPTALGFRLRRDLAGNSPSYKFSTGVTGATLFSSASTIAIDFEWAKDQE